MVCVSCKFLTYHQGYNTCVQCAKVQNDLIIGIEYVTEPFVTPAKTKIKQIDLPRKGKIFREINKFIRLKMTNDVREELGKLGDLQRSSRSIAIGFIGFKNYIQLRELKLRAKISTNVVNNIILEVAAVLNNTPPTFSLTTLETV
jgi:hypothetical protein